MNEKEKIQIDAIIGLIILSFATGVMFTVGMIILYEILF
jgi:hypothetical protein